MLISTIASWAATLTYQNMYLQDLATVLLVATVTYLVFEILLIKFGSSRISDKRTRYSLNKVFYVLSIVIFLVVSMLLVVQDPSSLLVTFGIIGAAIAFALQDVFKNFVGSIIIMGGNLFRVGDRIEIEGFYGDVMDIGLMNSTLMEIREWVDGDQATGRINLVPNGLVIAHTVHNYTKDHSFIWDEIFIPVTYNSDWKKAISIITEVITRETGEVTSRAEAEIERLGEKYYLSRSVIEPAVYLRFTDNWIALYARYTTDVRNRRVVNTRLSRLILERLEVEPDITVASQTETVTVIQQEPVAEKGEPGKRT
ncbi:small-conductance mechanosensitive channel [Methanolinea mesophila]|uniref:mechanosensitive ion channel family protein n=1 Tax=Methanolinea mesophila TaxID=547055 RepID=UPI001AE49B59|nr:mechanosensitive ion channel domain-containing protein [Methanolinea mesophila]MBP1927472.1 small-conductance mechanosensitive channel [Methanolinea mesophila]